MTYRVLRNTPVLSEVARLESLDGESQLKFVAVERLLLFNEYHQSWRELYKIIPGSRYLLV